jgi:hypothetical protein
VKTHEQRADHQREAAATDHGVLLSCEAMRVRRLSAP